jgi:hypothetical protein
MRWFLALFLTFLTYPLAADPVTLAVAAATATSATYAASVAAIAAGTAMTTAALVNYFVFTFALSVGLSYLTSALSPKPKLGGFDTGYEVAGVGAAQNHAIIYGQTRCGGVVVYKEATDDNKYLHLVVAVAGHECEEITSVYFNDEVLTLDGSGNSTSPDKYDGFVRIIKHLGADAQTADATLVAESDGKWTSDHRLQGIAYVYIRLEFNGDAFPNGEPAISFLVKGKKVYNPNTAATAWSDNAALCLRDYLTSANGLNTTDLDETLFGAAANVCDENVTLAAGGTEKRYTCNGSFTTQDTPRGLIDNLLTSLAGTLWYAQGKWRVKAAAYTTPLVAFDEDDLRSSIRINTRHSRRDNFNTVKGVFKGPESNYQTSDYPQVTSTTFIDIDGGDESVIDFNLPFTSTSTMAQRIAKIALYRNREQLTVSATFGLRAFQVQVGDLVKLTNSRAGWTEKVFEVNNWTFKPEADQSLTVTMDLREISSGVFSWNAEESTFDQNNTTLANPFDVPAIGLVVTSDARIINEHLINVISATTSTSAPERVDQTEVQFKKSSDSNWRSAGFGEIGITEIIDVEDSTFDVRARAINTFGIKGDWNTRSNFVVENLADPPANVTDFSFNVSSAGILLEWEAVADLDLSFYRIRHSFVESGATYGSSITAVDKVARPANSVLVPPTSGTYLIKAYDKSGNQSAAAATVIIRAEDLNTYGTTQRQTEHTAFGGTKSGCSVADNRLRITDPSSQPSTATYTFGAHLDAGAVRVCKVAMEIENLRLDTASTVTFDTLDGNFDALPGMFDDLTGGTNFTDTNVIQYVSTTNDDPGSSPTWSAYKRFKAGDFSGRGFRFKVDLKSTSDGVTPALAQLAATVRY